LSALFKAGLMMHACESRQQKYLDTEAQAKSKEISFWGLQEPVMPQDYRSGERSSTSSQLSQSSHFPVLKTALVHELGEVKGSMI